MTDEGRAGRAVAHLLPVYILNLLLSVILFYSLILSVFTPLPQIYCYLRYGRWAGLSIPLLLVIGLSVAAPGAGISYLLQFGLPAIVFSESIRRSFSINKCFAATALTALAAFMLLIFSASLSEGVSPNALVENFSNKLMTEAIALNKDAGLSPAQLKEYSEIAPKVSAFIAMVYPALVLAAMLMTFWLNLLILSKYLLQTGFPPLFSDLSSWKAPDQLAWGVIFGGLTFLFQSQTLSNVGMNILIALFVIYFIQGMAIISFHFNKRSVSGFLKGMFYLFIIWYMSLLIAIIGFFDTWADFRKLAPVNENKT